MSPQQYCWWLKGALAHGTPSPEALALIKQELLTVFKDHIDPSFPAEKQQALHQAHTGQHPHAGTSFNPQPPLAGFKPILPDLDWDQTARC